MIFLKNLDVFFDSIKNYHFESGVGWIGFALLLHSRVRDRFHRKQGVVVDTRIPSDDVPLSVRQNFPDLSRSGAFQTSTRSSTAPRWRTARRNTCGRRHRMCSSRSSDRAWRSRAGRSPEVTWRWFCPKGLCEQHHLVGNSSCSIF